MLPTSGLRLIPALDENERFVLFAQSFTGKLLLALLSAALLCAFRLEFSLPYSLLAFFLVCAPLRAELKLLLAGAAGWIFFERPAAYYALYDNLINPVFVEKFLGTGAYSYEFSVVYRAVTAVVLFALLSALLFFRRNAKVFWLATFLFAVSVFFLPKTGWAGLILWTSALIFFKGLVGIFFALDPDEIPKKSGLAGKAVVAFQLLGHGISVPLLQSPAQLTDFPHRARCQIKGVKLLLWGLLLHLGNETLMQFVFGNSQLPAIRALVPQSLGWVNYIQAGMDAFNLRPASPLKNWAVLLLVNWDYLLRTAVITSFYIGIIRLSGIYLPRWIYRPYLAVSFNDYFRRCFYFYSEFLLAVFYAPAWKWLRGTRLARPVRIFLATFFAVGLGGWLFHIARWVNRILYFEPSYYLGLYLSITPYFFLLGLFTAISALRNTPRAWRPASLLWVPVYFVFHSLVMVAFALEKDMGVTQRLAFLASLVGR
ncbi:MAG: hypothetical protein AB7K68_10435 [Bacteriovoracia bacterium]